MEEEHKYRRDKRMICISGISINCCIFTAFRTQQRGCSTTLSQLGLARTRSFALKSRLRWSKSLPILVPSKFFMFTYIGHTNAPQRSHALPSFGAGAYMEMRMTPSPQHCKHIYPQSLSTLHIPKISLLYFCNDQMAAPYKRSVFLSNAVRTLQYLFLLKEHSVQSLSGPWSNANNNKQQQAWAVEQGYRCESQLEESLRVLKPSMGSPPGKSMFDNSSFLKDNTPLWLAENKRIFAHWHHKR